MTANPNSYFDDFLDVMETDLTGPGLILFHGCSGSGKSTYLKQLENHPSFTNHNLSWFYSDPRRDAHEHIRSVDGPTLALVDELTRLRDLTAVWSLLRRFDAVAVATHLHPRWFSLLQNLRHAHVFHTGTGHEKIERYLTHLGHTFRGSDVHAMCAQFGASYVIADIIREHHPSPNFSDSWSHFSSFASLKSRRAPAHRDWRIRLG